MKTSLQPCEQGVLGEGGQRDLLDRKAQAKSSCLAFRVGLIGKWYQRQGVGRNTYFPLLNFLTRERLYSTSQEGKEWEGQLTHLAAALSPLRVGGGEAEGPDQPDSPLCLSLCLSVGTSPPEEGLHSLPHPASVSARRGGPGLAETPSPPQWGVSWAELSACSAAVSPRGVIPGQTSEARGQTW